MDGPMGRGITDEHLPVEVQKLRHFIEHHVELEERTRFDMTEHSKRPGRTVQEEQDRPPYADESYISFERDHVVDQVTST